MIEVDALVKHSVCYASTIAPVPRDKKATYTIKGITISDVIGTVLGIAGLIPR